MEDPLDTTALVTARAAAVERIATLRAEVAWLAGDADDPNGDDEHDPEGSTLAFERARVAALLTNAESAVAELDVARTRMEDGSYATCATCGRPISRERLDALPAARTCFTCASASAR